MPDNLIFSYSLFLDNLNLLTLGFQLFINKLTYVLRSNFFLLFLLYPILCSHLSEMFIHLYKNRNNELLPLNDVTRSYLKDRASIWYNKKKMDCYLYFPKVCLYKISVVKLKTESLLCLTLVCTVKREATPIDESYISKIFTIDIKHCPNFSIKTKSVSCLVIIKLS